MKVGENNNKKFKWTQIGLPAAVIILLAIFGYLLDVRGKLSSISTNINYLAKNEDLINKANELENNIATKFKIETDKIYKSINATDRNVLNIINKINDVVIPRLQKFPEEKIERIEYEKIYGQFDSINNNLENLTSSNASIQETLDETSFLLAGSLPENIMTVEGRIESVDRITQEMVFWSYQPVVAEHGVQEEKILLNFTKDTYVSIKGDRPIADVSWLDAEQNVKIRYYKWQGRTYIKSVEILKEPIKK